MTPAQQQKSTQPGFARELNLADGIAIVVGTIIGSGVFLVPRSIAGELSPVGAVLLIWIAGGALSLFGGLALGELGAMFPEAGGLYVYLRRIYGKPTGFLYGWGLLTIIHSGSIATLAVAFRLYLGQTFSLGQTAQKLVGVGCVLFLTGLNCLGLRPAKLVQNISALSKIAGLGAMIVLVLWRTHGHWPPGNLWFQGIGQTNWVHWGVALVAVLWAYEGWHVVSFTAGEFKRTQKDLPRALFCGTLIVALIYVLANLAYYSALSRAEIQRSDCVAATAMYQTFGPIGATCISVLILISIFGAANGMVLTGPRVYYAMARDGLFLALVQLLESAFSNAPGWHPGPRRLGILADGSGHVHAIIHIRDFHLVDLLRAGCRRRRHAPLPRTQSDEAIPGARIALVGDTFRAGRFGDDGEHHSGRSEARGDRHCTHPQWNSGLLFIARWNQTARRESNRCSKLIPASTALRSTRSILPGEIHLYGGSRNCPLAAHNAPTP